MSLRLKEKEGQLQSAFHYIHQMKERELSGLMVLGRNNSGIAIGDTISVRKIKAVAAEKVVVAPLEAIPPIDERYLADALESVPLIKGDNVMVPYFGGRLTFQVIGVTPAADAVLVTQKTVFHIAEKGETLRGVPQVTYEDIGGLTDEIKKLEK